MPGSSVSIGAVKKALVSTDCRAGPNKPSQNSGECGEHGGNKDLPHTKKVQEAIGEEASKELADLINQALAQDQKVPDKNQYEIIDELIDEKLRCLETKLEAEINSTLFKGIVFGTLLMFTLFGCCVFWYERSNRLCTVFLARKGKFSLEHDSGLT